MLEKSQPTPTTVICKPSVVAHLARPAPLEHDAVQIDIRMHALDRFVAPGLDLDVDLLVQVRDRPRRDPRAPQGLGDVLHPPDRDTGQIHLHQGLLDRGLAPAVALDDRRLERLPAQLGHLQRNLASPRLQLPLVAPRPRVLASLRALVAFRLAKPIRLRIQKRVQRLLHAASHDLAQVILNTLVVNPDHVRQARRAILLHRASPRASRLLFSVRVQVANSNLTRFGATNPKMCERYFTLSA